MIVTRGFGERQAGGRLAVITRGFSGIKYATGFQTPEKIDELLLIAKEDVIFMGARKPTFIEKGGIIFISEDDN